MPATAGVQSARANGQLIGVQRDSRGWIVIDVPPKSPIEGPIFLDKIISGKRLVLVRQEEDTMRVYVNPDRNGWDEWEVPVGSGKKLLIASPPAVPAVTEAV